MKLQRPLILMLAILLGTVVPAAPASAIFKKDLRHLNNDSVFTDLTDGGTCEDSAGSAAPGKDNIETVWNNLIAKGLKPFQVAGIMGNMQTESAGTFDPLIVQPRRDGTGGGRSKNPADSQDRGYGLVQWSPGIKLSNVLNFLKISYAQNGPTIPDEINALWTQFTNPDSPESEKAAGDAVRASTTIEEATQAFELKFERHAGDPQPERTAQAQDILKLAQTKNWSGANDSAPPVSAAPTDNPCLQGLTSTGVFSGDIIKTAIGLAWPKPTGHDPKQPTPAYREAWNHASNYTDCGAFVATVMQTSGADPNYPDVGTAIQKDYVLGHPEKYETYTNITTSGPLHQGDILVFNNGGPTGHTMIYLGPQPGGFVVADASLGDHTPQLNTPGDLSWMLSQPNVVVARVIK